jgi:hypothetical protein
VAGVPARAIQRCIWKAKLAAAKYEWQIARIGRHVFDPWLALT